MENSNLEEHLYFLEERLLQPGVRHSTAELEVLLADDFKEFGSSGRTFNKQQSIDGLANEVAVQRSIMDFHAKLLAPDIALTTYGVLRQPEKKYSLRSSIWKMNEGKWQMLFHQGTPSVAP